jgi:hypothetical protein
MPRATLPRAVMFMTPIRVVSSSNAGAPS